MVLSRVGRVRLFSTPQLTESPLHKDQETTASCSAATEAAVHIDAKAAEQIRIATEIGEEGFEENIKILKQMFLRGLRAFLIFMLGLGAFFYSKKRLDRRTTKREAIEG
ncbi:unnamed protein product [Phytomonas sp. EM1]|nr:unnamed protein product [Phytomonas sp. EM1]|eukprot:CCW62100.1 unnamed protein product [Phytomonas sp. isolate EM1]